jgi:hypothetical protein
MWARLSEICVALWLFVSFRDWNDRVCAVAIVVISIASMLTRARRMYLLNGLVAIYLLIVGFVAAGSGDPIGQNDILVALVLLMLAIIPNEASQPPKRWRDFIRAHS